MKKMRRNKTKTTTNQELSSSTTTATCNNDDSSHDFNHKKILATRWRRRYLSRSTAPLALRERRSSSSYSAHFEGERNSSNIEDETSDNKVTLCQCCQLY